jgi:diacylglycerol kinase family enzyme
VEDPSTIKKKKKTTQPDQPSQIHVKSLTVSSSSSQKFPIILDGEIYGPFHKIIVESSKAMTVDVPCFEKLY